MEQTTLKVKNPKTLTKGAVLSPCRSYRYTLWRRWDNRTGIVFIGLNPSTADEKLDDPTIRRCIGFAKRWGFGRFTMLNIFAHRSTDPDKLKTHETDPVGPDNDQYIWDTCMPEDDTWPIIVCAWGSHGKLMDRGKIVYDFLVAAGTELFCLGTTQSGQPKHPLYLRKDLEYSTFKWV